MSEPIWCDAPQPWTETVVEILNTRPSRVLVLGAADAGKSTFCRELLTAAARLEISSGLLDCDPGQKMVGPPAAVTYAQVHRPDVLAALGFLGSTNPLHCMDRIGPAIGGLITQVAPSILVVNTGGFLSGAGLHLKAEKLAVLRPNLVVGIGQDAGLDAVLSAHADVPLLRIAPSPMAGRKSRNCRRTLRRDAFRRYLESAGRVVLPQILAPEPPTEGRLVGLRDDDGVDRALGIVTQVGSDTVEVLTPMAPQHPSSLLAGRLTLDSEFSEHPVNETI